MDLEINAIIQEPIQHHMYSNCIQDIFITYLKWKEEDYIKLFDHTWSFHYVYDTCFEIDIYRNGFSQIYQSLNHNFGLEVMPIETDHFSEIYFELSSGNPMAACVDTYYCNWHNSCHKYHNRHYVLLVGYSKGAFLCMDPYASRKLERIEASDFHTVVDEVLSFQQTEPQAVCWEKNIISLIENMMGSHKQTSDFKKINRFAEDFFSRTEQFMEEMNHYDNISFWPFLLKLNNVGYGRKCFSIYLDRISQEQKKETEICAHKLEEYANEWSRLSSLFVKYKLLNFSDAIKNRIHDKLLYLSEAEEGTALELLGILRQRMIPVS